ncbi:MAG: POTRA domain-containing protein [Candidatus Sulfotelmatobacter sp.]
MKLFPQAFLARLLFSSLLLSLSAAAQISGGAQPPSAYKLIEVKVTGSKRFTQEDIVAASGLPVGTVAHEEDFKKAARQLGETGAFGVINFTYTYSSAGTRLEFQVTDADKFVPAHFADFVWFTDEELHQKLHDRVPLFNGELPTNGRLPDQVSDVLQALLVENGIPGIVQYARTEAKDERLESIDYTVVGVSIRIHQAQFPGAGAAELPLLQAAAEKLSDREYSRDYMANFVEHSLLPIYHERGYLKASCARPQPKVVKLPAADSTDNKQPPTYVDITFPVTPGLQYKVTQWDWSGNKEIPKDQLDPFLHAKTGLLANTVQLANDLRQVQTLYGSRGYILAEIKVNAEFDDVSGTVAYHLIVHEDSLFRMGDLEFRGIDNSLTARLRAAWKLRPGDVYDATYLKQFLPEARKLLPPTLDWDVDPHVTAIARDKTVDVDLQYTAKATK